jgi:hypothetical protein
MIISDFQAENQSKNLHGYHKDFDAHPTQDFMHKIQFILST